MTGKDRREVYGPRPLGAVEPPYRFGNLWAHVHRFGAIAPAGRHSQRHANTFAGELFSARGSLRHATDTRVGNGALYWQPARMTQILRNVPCRSLRHAH